MGSDYHYDLVRSSKLDCAQLFDARGALRRFKGRAAANWPLFCPDAVLLLDDVHRALSKESGPDVGCYRGYDLDFRTAHFLQIYACGAGGHLEVHHGLHRRHLLGFAGYAGAVLRTVGSPGQ